MDMRMEGPVFYDKTCSRDIPLAMQDFDRWWKSPAVGHASEVTFKKIPVPEEAFIKSGQSLQKQDMSS